MYSTDRYPRALRFTAENRLLSPSMKAVVRPESNGPKYPPSALRSSVRHAPSAQANPRLIPASPGPTHSSSQEVFWPPRHPSNRECLDVNALKHQCKVIGHASHTPLQGHRLLLLGFFLHPVHLVKIRTIKKLK